MIVASTTADFREIHAIINDAASAYKGIIPADRWHEPYMGEEELRGQIEDGVEFWSFAEKERLLRRYWKIPPRQIETSVVLVTDRWPGEPAARRLSSSSLRRVETSITVLSVIDTEPPLPLL